MALEPIISARGLTKSFGPVAVLKGVAAQRGKAAVAVTPNKHGECFKLEAQSNAGSWDPNVTSACAALTTTSKGTGYLTLTKASYRYPYRVRVDFVPGKSDKINVASSSGWLYFMVEK